MAQNPNASWAEIDLELWLLFINQTQSGTFQAPFKCYDYNYRGLCRRLNCTYSHACIKCYGSHPVISCNCGSSGIGFSASNMNRPRLQVRSQGNNFRHSYPRSRAPGSVVGHRPFAS